MDTRPEIDMDKYRDFREADKPQEVHDEPKDPAARFCSADCRLAYREDRIIGKPLPPVNMDGQTVSHKTMCARLSLCTYCLSKLNK